MMDMCNIRIKEKVIENDAYEDKVQRWYMIEIALEAVKIPVFIE